MVNKSLRDSRNFARKRFRKGKNALVSNGRQKTAINVPSGNGPKTTEALSSVALESGNGGGTEDVRAQLPHNVSRNLRIAYTVGNDLIWR
jgi:hypothetical protein